MARITDLINQPFMYLVKNKDGEYFIYTDGKLVDVKDTNVVNDKDDEFEVCSKEVAEHFAQLYAFITKEYIEKEKKEEIQSSILRGLLLDSVYDDQIEEDKKRTKLYVAKLRKKEVKAKKQRNKKRKLYYNKLRRNK